MSFQALDGSVDLQMFLQSDPGPQRVHLRTVAHMLQRVLHRTELCAVVPHQHLDKGHGKEKTNIYKLFPDERATHVITHNITLSQQALYLTEYLKKDFRLRIQIKKGSI